MPAHPTLGDPYRQEYYRGQAEDMAQVLSLTESASVPYGDYTNLLMTKEWSPLDPAVVEHKYYAPGIGFVLVTTGGEDWRLSLVEMRHD
jgi:hypothetical protein